VIVGVLVLDLRTHSHSLKEKRHIVSSMKEKLKNRFNISLIESDYHDMWQEIQLAAAMVADSKIMIEKTFDQIEDLVFNNYPVQIVSVNKDFL